MELLTSGKAHPLVGQVVIGSDPQAGVSLHGAGVLPRHAVLRVQSDGHVVLERGVPEAEVWLNGERLGREPTPLLHGDKLRIGGHALQVSDPARAGSTRLMEAPAGGGPRARLISVADGREYQVGASLVLGREALADVVVTDPDASRRHAEFAREGEGWVVVDHSTNGTFVNGARVTGRQPLHTGDRLAIGGAEFVFRQSGDDPKPPSDRPVPTSPPAPPTPPPGAEHRLHDTMMGMPVFGRTPPSSDPGLGTRSSLAPVLGSLLIRNGTRKGDRIPIRTPVVQIGRGEYCEVQLTEPSVSQNHAKLSLRGGVWILEDVGSTNGSFVQGEPVRGEVAVAPGSTLRFGEVSVLFEPVDAGTGRKSGTQVLRSPAPGTLGRIGAVGPESRGLPTGLIVAAVVLVLALLLTFLVL